MRKTVLFLTVFALVGSLLAADPTIGKWKLNIEKSKFSPTEPAPKESTLTKRGLDANQYEIVITGTHTDGSKISMKFTHPQQGGIEKDLSPGPEDEMFVVTIMGPGEFIETGLRKGKQFIVYHSVVSKDGKEMRVKVIGTDAKGKPYEGLEVWEKQ